MFQVEAREDTCTDLYLFLDGDVPRSPSYGVYISQLIVLLECVLMLMTSTTETYFLTAKLLKQGYRYHKIRKAFSKFYHSHSELIGKSHSL